jgi:hypothetical protein
LRCHLIHFFLRSASLAVLGTPKFYNSLWIPSTKFTFIKAWLCNLADQHQFWLFLQQGARDLTLPFKSRDFTSVKSGLFSIEILEMPDTFHPLLRSNIPSNIISMRYATSEPKMLPGHRINHFSIQDFNCSNSWSRTTLSAAAIAKSFPRLW